MRDLALRCLNLQLKLLLGFWCSLLIVGHAFALQQTDNAQSGTAVITKTSGTIGAGNPWETQWYAIDSGLPGPTVLVTGGVHGNEPAGFRAARQIQYWPINSGRLVVIPRVNTLGLQANTRWIPKHRNDKKLRDLNRNFPTDKRPDTQTELAAAVWDYVKQLKPDYVFDLHEGFAIHRVNSKSVGSSVISFPDSTNVKLAKSMVAAVNATIENEQHHFSLLAGSGPAVGSLARAAGEQLGAKAYILETTSRDQPVSKRTRQHRRMMFAAFTQIGILPDESNAYEILAPVQSKLTTVALFDGPGTGASRKKVARLIDQQSRGFVAYIGVDEIKPDVLEQFDVLVFPGGSASKQAKALGADRRQSIRDYVASGGGYVGICAGAYLCSSHYEWSLYLINTRVYNEMVDIEGVGRKSMWYRGKATDVKVEFTNEGEVLLGKSGTHSVRYQNGPIISPAKNHRLGDYRVLAHFRSENYRYDQQKGTMIDTAAIVYAHYGDGIVFSVSPHFESTPAMESLIWKVIRKTQRLD